MKVGYVGLGAMGKALAGHLLGVFPTTVWDINPNTLKEFEALGGTAAASLSALAAESDIIILCLPKSYHVEQALFGENGIASSVRVGTIIVDQTSGDPAQTILFAERLNDYDVSLIDAPIAGGIPAAYERKISIMVSGNTASIQQAMPVLKAISPNVFLCGDSVGSAQTLKSINNSINSVNRLATLELAALGRRLGLSFQQVRETLDQGLSKSFLTERLLAGIANSLPSTDFAINGMLKDVVLSTGMAQAYQIARPVNDTARNMLAMTLTIVGQDSRLEDLIRLTEKLMSIAFMDSTQSITNEGNEVGEKFALSLQAIHALGVVENIALLKALGVDLNGAGLVLANGSAANEMLNQIFAHLTGSQVKDIPSIATWIEALSFISNETFKFDCPTPHVSSALDVLFGMTKHTKYQDDSTLFDLMEFI